jgi:hypothetical protein
MQPPDEAGSLIGPQPALSGLAILLNFLYLRRVGDVVPTRSVNFEVAGFILALQRSGHEEHAMHPKHGKPLLRWRTGEEFRVGHYWLVEHLVAIVVMNHAQHGFERSFRNEYRPDPVMDQPIGHAVGAVFLNLRH